MEKNTADFNENIKSTVNTGKQWKIRLEIEK